ncbi:MAG: PaaI family thioesterase [Rhodocyclales bacterium]|nr:PaaI family thioesterase [Rhodocyclales bacterium]
MTQTPDLLALGRRILAEQPFSVLLGAELTAFEPGRAELRLLVRHDLKQQYGFVHGGVLSYLADNALTYAGGSALSGQGIVTSEFKINYLRPAIGDTLVARAQVVHAGKSQAVCRCDVFALAGTEEKLCATAQGTITAPAGAASREP